MRRTVLVVGLVLLLASGAFAYTSDRMDFGEIDFGGETVYFLRTGMQLRSLKKEEGAQAYSRKLWSCSISAVMKR